MRRIDEHRWRTAHAFKPTGADRGCESGPHRVDVELAVRAGAEERLHGRQCHRRVVGLVLTVQRQEDVGVHPAEALQVEQLAADRDPTAQHGEFAVLPRHGGIAAHRLRQQHLHRFGCLTADDRDGVDGYEIPTRCGDHTGLLGGDLGDGLT